MRLTMTGYSTAFKELPTNDSCSVGRVLHQPRATERLRELFDVGRVVAKYKGELAMIYTRLRRCSRTNGETRAPNSLSQVRCA